MELNLYYEFSSHKIPIRDSTKEQKKTGDRTSEYVASLPKESFDERTNILLYLRGWSVRQQKV